MPKRTAAALGAVITLVLGTGVVLASHQFPDVPNSHIFHDDIAWLNDNDITRVEEGNNWRPDASTTRGQMAAFLHRFHDVFALGTIVTALAEPWTATNGTVSITPDGVEFGPYADGGAAGGSVCYSGTAGAQLSGGGNRAYCMRYTSTGHRRVTRDHCLRVLPDGGQRPG